MSDLPDVPMEELHRCIMSFCVDGCLGASGRLIQPGIRCPDDLQFEPSDGPQVEFENLLLVHVGKGTLVLGIGLYLGAIPWLEEKSVYFRWPLQIAINVQPWTWHPR